MSKTKIERVIDDYFNKSYPFLTKVAKNCLLKLKRQDLYSDLITESYLYITKNQDSFKDKIEEGLIQNIAVNFINQQTTWTHTSFYRNYIKTKANNTEFDFTHYSAEQEEFLPEEDKLNEDSLLQEKLEQINLNITHLSVDKQILLNLFLDGINTSGKLQRYYQANLPKDFKAPARISCWRQITQLKECVTSGITTS